MADNITAPAAGAVLATDEIGGVHYPRTKVAFGANGTATDVTAADRLPVQTQTGLATEAKQDAMISAIENMSPGGGGGGDASAANQDEQTALLTTIAALINAADYYPATQPVSGAVSVSGNVAVTGPLTDAQLRAAALPVSAASLPLPDGAGTSAKQDTIITALGALGTQTTLAAILAKLIAAPATEAKQDALIAQTTLPAGTDRSGSITAGGTAQTLASANAARKSLTVQNISDADMWINEIGATATADTAGSWKVSAGQAFSVSTNRAVSIVGATTGKKFTATEI